MAAPGVTARVIPGAGSFKMPDGFKSTIAFASDPSIWIWESAEGGVKPFGVDGGEKISTTTMLNIAFRTFRARKLKTLTDLEVKAAYDPDVINNIMNLVNNEQAITQLFPENSKWAFWGYLMKFIPGPLEEGKMPVADLSIAVTNWDPVNQVEAGPAFTLSTGT